MSGDEPAIAKVDGADAPAPPYHPDQLDVYLRRRGGGGGAVYLALLLLLAASLAALPAVMVPVSVPAQGYVRGEEDSRLLLSPVAARVAWVRDRTWRTVRAGDTVVLLERPELIARAVEMGMRRAALEEEAEDLLALIAWAEGGSMSPTPTSLRYGQEWNRLQVEQQVAGQREDAAERDVRRLTALFERGLAPAAELAALQDRVEQLRQDASLLRARAGTTWSGELAGVQDALRSLSSEAAAIAGEMQRLAVISPVDGTIDDLAPLSSGSLVTAAQRLATVAPASELIAELYVDPERLDGLRIGAEARLQAQSDRFSSWGAIEGSVFEISPELIRVGDRPVGRVRVRLHSQAPPRPGGMTSLRRGSSVSARIPAAPRSLLALLRARRGEPPRAAPIPTPGAPTPAG